MKEDYFKEFRITEEVSADLFEIQARVHRILEEFCPKTQYVFSFALLGSFAIAAKIKKETLLEALGLFYDTMINSCDEDS